MSDDRTTHIMAVPWFGWHPVIDGVLTVLVMGILMATAHADVRFDDGGDHLIDYNIDDSLGVSGNPGGTHATLLPGSWIAGDLWVGEDGKVSIEGGEVSGSVITAGDGIVTMSAGAVGGDVEAGGDLGYVSLSGGTIGGELIVDDGLFVIVGTDFLVDRQPIVELDAEPWPTIPNSAALRPPLDVILSGTLSDGTPFANSAHTGRFGFGAFILQTVPEPSSGVLSALGLMCLLWLGSRRPRE